MFANDSMGCPFSGKCTGLWRRRSAPGVPVRVLVYSRTGRLDDRSGSAGISLLVLDSTESRFKSRVGPWRDLHDQQLRDARQCPFKGIAPQCGQSPMSGHVRCLSTHRLGLELQMLLIIKFK